MSLAEVIQLFESRQTIQLSDRHAESIENLCRVYKKNNSLFYYNNIQELSHLFGLIQNSLINEKVEIVQPFISLLSLCCLGFKKVVSSDEFNHVPNLPLFFNSLCPFLRCDKFNKEKIDTNLIISKTCQVITEFASFGVDEIKQEADEEHKSSGTALTLIKLYSEGTKNLRALYESNVPETLVEVLAACNRIDDYMESIIEALSHTSLYRPISLKYAKMGMLKDLVQIIAEAKDFRSYVVLISIDAIWNVVEVGGAEIQEALEIEEVSVCLKKTFRRVLLESYKLDDKCLRNELCILINYVVSAKKSHVFFTAKDNEKDLSFIELLISYAVHDELLMLSKESQNEKFFFTSKEEDSEFKRLLWTCILHLIKNKEAKDIQKIIVEQNLVKGLLLYINPDQASQATHKFQTPQLKEIQLQALTVISTTIGLVPEHFYQLGGHTFLMKFLTSFPDSERRLSCLKALNCTSKYDFFKKDFTDSGIIDSLFEIIQQQKEVSLEIREYCFNILSNVCKNFRPAQKEFRRKSGVELIKESLASNLKGESGNTSTYFLALNDCLQNAILPNKRSELHFIEIGGVYTLLDILEVCQEMLSRVFLSTLCTLVENQKAIQMYVEWDSARTTINATQLMIRLYTKEDLRFGVLYENGVLKNSDWPLNPREDKSKSQSIQNAVNTASKENTVNSLTLSKLSSVHVVGTNGSVGSDSKKKFDEKVKDATEVQKVDESGCYTESYIYKRMQEESNKYDLRATIFAVLYRTGFDLHELLPEEKQKLDVIQIYPLLKNGEIWRKNKEYLDSTNNKPTSDDKHWMETCIEEAKEQAEAVIYNQKLFAQDVKNKANDELNTVYSSIRLKNQTKGTRPTRKWGK